MHDDDSKNAETGLGDRPEFGPGQRVAVLLPLPLAGPYDYLVGDQDRFQLGDIVDVPLGTRRATGVVWGRGEGEVAPAKLRTVYVRRDTPPLSTAMIRLVDWVAGYTLYPQGAVLKMVLSVPDALEQPATLTAYTLAATPSEFRTTKARDRVLAFLKNNPPLPAADIAREAGCGASVVKGLAEAGALVAVNVQPLEDWPVPDHTRRGVTLSADQLSAAEMLAGDVGAGFKVTLIDGVPGSGKTEV